MIVFENSNNNSVKNMEWIKRRMHLVFVRNQTEKEAMDALTQNRMFNSYGYFIDEKYNGNIERVLEDNYIADKNNVKSSERKIIRERLRTAYYEYYNIQREVQTALIFD